MQHLEQKEVFLRVGDGQPQYMMLGVLSKEEVRTIGERAEVISNDHFVGCDVSGSKKLIRLRSGRTLEVIAPKLVLVKCLSSVDPNGVFHNHQHPLRPDGSL